MVAIIHSERRVADRRLRQYFNSNRQQWIDVVKAAVQARSRCTADNSKAAPGFYAWDAATARKRQIFRREGWESGDHNGIEVIINHQLKKMIAVMNTDSGTSDITRSPQNRTPKGSATEKVVDLNNQYELFRAHELSGTKEPPYSLWYLCIFDDGAKVRAELSRPSEYRGGSVVKFNERIFILQGDDWERVLLERDDGNTDAVQITVRRRP